VVKAICSHRTPGSHVRRLSVSLLIVVLLSTIGLGWAIDRLFVGFGKTEADGLQVYRDIGNDLIASGTNSNQLEKVVESWPQTNPIALRLLSDEELALPIELEQQLRSGDPLVLESESSVELLFLVPGADQVLSLSPPETQSETPLRFLLTMLFYGGMICLVLLWIYPLARRLLALGRTARAFGEGQLDRRVATHQRSFLYGIESEFNSMAQRIQSLIADNKMLASAVSHDLRTPLARLRFGIDLLDEAKDEEVRAEYQFRLSSDLTAMENLVEVLLEYARLDQQLSDMPQKPTDLADIVSGSVQSLSGLVGKNIHWQPGQDNWIIEGHERYVTMLINNLLQNAVNYCDQHVRVSLVKRRNRVGLIVEDDGPGIPEEKRHEMLKPFVRGDQDNTNMAGKGYGMGLAIVSRIAEWHNAQCIVSASESLGGARFEILFPVASPAMVKSFGASVNSVQETATLKRR